MREFGSLAVFALVNFFFMPVILAQKESRREPPSGWGGFKFMPCAFAEARPLAFKPPLGFLPSLRCQAGVLAIEHHRSSAGRASDVDIRFTQDAFTRDNNVH